MRHIYILGLAIIFMVVGAFLFNIRNISAPAVPETSGASVVMAGESFNVEVARTPGEQIRGLSGHAPLAGNAGMLFAFPAPAPQSFWMKDMLFPIDIIWINNSAVAGLVPRALPDDSPARAIYYSPEPVQYVLEVPAGTSDRLGIKPGTSVKIFNP